MAGLLLLLLPVLAAGCARAGTPPETAAPASLPQAQTLPETTFREEPPPRSRQTDWQLLLVNPWNPIPADFSVTLAAAEEGEQMDQRVCPALLEMLADARQQGLDPVLCSGYRSREKQQTLYSHKVGQYLSLGYSQEEAAAAAGRIVAVPGTSEHETGLAADLMARSYPVLDQAQEETAEQRWLMENAHRYGFILRYPADKTDITGISYEPWHYRYVGQAAAREIYEQGLCLEEYLGLPDQGG